MKSRLHISREIGELHNQGLVSSKEALLDSNIIQFQRLTLKIDEVI